MKDLFFHFRKESFFHLYLKQPESRHISALSELLLLEKVVLERSSPDAGVLMGSQWLYVLVNVTLGKCIHFRNTRNQPRNLYYIPEC